jgi:Na+/H+ antiporter NhaA
MRTETGGALVLLGATLAALAWANLPWWHTYEAVWRTPLSIRVGRLVIAQDLRHWVNNGLMTFYFLVVGLEAKRELDIGELRERRRGAISMVAALGGMVVPVVIYLAVNAGGQGGRGWGAAMSTDTAFALGVLALVAPPSTRLRVRLLTLTLSDDVVALLVIIVAYTGRLSLVPLLIAIGPFTALLALRYAPYAWRLEALAALGAILWLALYESRLDPVVCGLAVGLLTSAHVPHRAKLERAVELTRSFREQPTPELARSTQRGVASAISLNDRLQHRLHPWTSFAVVPLFALANAGIHVSAGLLERAFTSPITLGILAAYVLGKPIGVVSSAIISLRLRVGSRALTTPAIVGVGAVAGVGFTVSLLISSLAFRGQALQEAKVGVLASALAATGLSWLVFRLIARLPKATRARQMAGTLEEIVDLSEDVDPGRDHIRGGHGAPVTLVEYGDYECPYCGQAEPVVRELLRSFGDDLRYVWRHLPLAEVHPHAQIAAEAAEAAGSQGAFWEMHDKLITHQDELTPSDLERYAAELALDDRRFWQELRQATHADRIAEDVASADASGVAGTPGFFINGKRQDSGYDIATLTAGVRAARDRAASTGTRVGAPVPRLRRRVIRERYAARGRRRAPPFS